MSCKTCDYALQSVAPDLFWCPRCGSLLFRYVKGGDDHYEPTLVQRAFTLCEAALFFCAEDEGHEAAALEHAERTVRECVLPPQEQ